MTTDAPTLEQRFVELLDGSRRRPGLDPARYGTVAEYTGVRNSLRAALSRGETFAENPELNAQARRLITQTESSMADQNVRQSQGFARRDIHDALIDLQ